jgi:DNA-3-methyladenine glycosylase
VTFILTAPLFHSGGIAYVYLIYGIYYCLNAVTEKEGEPCAVLIRGADIVYGFDTASAFRYNKPFAQLTKREVKNMANGPSKLCSAFNIGKTLNTSDLSNGELILADNVSSIECELLRSKLLRHRFNSLAAVALASRMHSARY